MGMWFFPAWGFLLWLLATIVMRVVGHHVLDHEQPIITTLLFLATIPLIAVATVPVYDWRRINLQDRPTAAILMALPGLLIDVPVLLLFSTIYPNLVDAGVLFGAWLLWAYGLVLISGLLPFNRLWKI